VTSGLHDDYHKVSDEPRKIDYAKLARVTRSDGGNGARGGERAEAAR
jgi:hypothetical protein